MEDGSGSECLCWAEGFSAVICSRNEFFAVVGNEDRCPFMESSDGIKWEEAFDDARKSRRI